MEFPAWLIYLLGGIVLLITAYSVYVMLRPAPQAALDKAIGRFSAYTDVVKLAPLGCPAPGDLRICDYYVAASAYSVFPADTVSDYVSDAVLALVIKSGARMVELDIYSDEQDQPVVGLKNQNLGYDYSYNNIPFQACCVAIGNTAFTASETPLATDPFILSLVFHTEKTVTLDATADVLKNTLRRYMLTPEYSYQRRDMSAEPMCTIKGKILLVSGGNLTGTKMEELVNLSWSSSNLRRLTYMQASQPYDHDELIDYNRQKITMVVPDATFSLKNSNPEILFAYGCQWNMVSYGSVDRMMEFYIGHFRERSFVEKPEALRFKKKTYTKPTPPDPGLSFQPKNLKTPVFNLTL
jgi:hypothetical protein